MSATAARATSAMTQAEWEHFLDEPARPGALAVVLPSGTPHVTPVWFVRDGRRILFTAAVGTVKLQAVEAGSHVSMCVHNQELPSRYVTVIGRATTTTDPAAVDDWMGRIEQRYDPARPTPTERRRAAELQGDVYPDAVLVEVVVERVIAHDFGR